MIKVLGISGSPRDGNSKYLLEKALDSAKAAGIAFGQEVSTEYWSVRGKKLSGCVACSACTDGVCIIKDDYQEISEKWLAADVVLYSIPVYHMGIPAQLKAVIDRIGNSLFGQYASIFPPDAITLPKSLKTIGCITQGAHIFAGQEHTITDIVNHAIIMGCIPVAGDMWESYTGAGGWTCKDMSKDAIANQYEAGERDALIAVKASEALARRAVEISAILKSGGAALKQTLEKQPIYKPFIEKI